MKDFKNIQNVLNNQLVSKNDQLKMKGGKRREFALTLRISMIHRTSGMTNDICVEVIAPSTPSNEI
jgi:hypothetical protein